MLKKWIRGLVFALVALVTLMVLFYAVFNWYEKIAWLKHRKSQVAAGVNYDIASLVPPPILDDQNMAAAPIFADLFQTNQPPIENSLRDRRGPSCAEAEGNWLLARVGNRTAWAECQTNSPWNTTFTNADLNAVLAGWAPVLTEVERAAERPLCRFPVRYEDGFACRLPHISPLLHISRVCRIKALLALDAGQTDAALREIKTTLRLARALEDEPLLISLLVRVALINMAIQPVWEGLAAHQWTGPQLTELQGALADLSLGGHLRRSIQAERLFGMWSMDQMIAQPAQFREFFTLSDDTGRQRRLEDFLWRAIPTGWLYLNQLNLDREYIRIISWLRDSENGPIDPAALAALTQPPQDPRKRPLFIISALLLPAMEGGILKPLRTECAAGQAVTACALERWFLKHGSYPERLDELVPALLSAVPRDIITKQPLRYRRDAPGQFVLYSIGWNGQDDGGQIAKTIGAHPTPDDRQADWAWQSSPAP